MSYDNNNNNNNDNYDVSKENKRLVAYSLKVVFWFAAKVVVNCDTVCLQSLQAIHSTIVQFFVRKIQCFHCLYS